MKQRLIEIKDWVLLISGIIFIALLYLIMMLIFPIHLIVWFSTGYSMINKLGELQHKIADKIENE